MKRKCNMGYTYIYCQKIGIESLFTSGVHLIVVLGFCKPHYRSYPYFIPFKQLMCSTLTETQFLVLKFILWMDIIKPLSHWTATVLRQLATDIASGSRSSVEKVASDS